MRPSLPRSQTGIGSVSSSVRLARDLARRGAGAGRGCGRPRRGARRRRAGAGRRGPPAVRPSASTWPPASVRTMMLKACPEVKSASSAVFRVAAEPGSSQLPEAQEAVGRVGQAGDALQGVGHDAQRLALLPEHQDLRLGADDRIGGGEAALQVGALGCGRGARLAARPADRQPDEDEPQRAPRRRPRQSGQPLGSQTRSARSPPEAMPATRTRTQARLAASRAASSRRMLPNRPLCPADCIGIRCRTGGTRGLETQRAKDKGPATTASDEANHGRLCGAGGGVARRRGPLRDAASGRVCAQVLPTRPQVAPQ